MSELLVRVVDKTNPNDIYKDCQLTKRGDVIAVCDDGWAWSIEERTSPAWRILKFPKVPKDQAEAFLTPEKPIDLSDKRATLLRRRFRIDIDNLALPAAVAPYLADEKRANADLVVDINGLQFEALKVTKSRLADPLVPTVLV